LINLESSKNVELVDIYQKLLKNSNFKDTKVVLNFNSPSLKEKNQEEKNSTINYTSLTAKEKFGTITSSISAPVKIFSSISEKSRDLESLNSMEISKINSKIDKNGANTINNSDNNFIEEIGIGSTKVTPDKIYQKITPENMILIVDKVSSITSPMGKTFFSKKESTEINSFSTSRNSKQDYNKNLPLSRTNLYFSTNLQKINGKNEKFHESKNLKLTKSVKNLKLEKGKEINCKLNKNKSIEEINTNWIQTKSNPEREKFSFDLNQKNLKEKWMNKTLNIKEGILNKPLSIKFAKK
jgi:hypothetical protein